MHKFISALPALVMSGLFVCFTACNESGEPAESNLPTFTVEIGTVTRTSVSFAIEAGNASSDYAYDILPASDPAPTAESLFETGTVGYFDSSHRAELVAGDLDGDSNYRLYTAVRRINPFVYSKLHADDIDTGIDFTEMITLEKAGKRTVSYHIMNGGGKYKHFCSNKVDYDWLKTYLGAYDIVTDASMLKVYGHMESGDATFTYDDFIPDGTATSYNTGSYIYAGTEYIITAAPVDDAGNVTGTVSTLVFTTKEPGTCPYDIEVEVTDIQSLSATARITPAEGIESFRVVNFSDADYESIDFEGDDAIRNATIGNWGDTSYEYTGAQEIELTGLMPVSGYKLCVIAFDSEQRELLKVVPFTSGNPTGPAPEIYMSLADNESPWSSATVNVRVENTVEMRGGIWAKSTFDAVVNNGYDINTVVYNNGSLFDDSILSAAMSENGTQLQLTELSPVTEYVFGLWAKNEEYVSYCDTLQFRTASVPPVSTDLYDVLQGRYTFMNTDTKNEMHQMEVTIADGVNDATRAAYKERNMLVILGFPCGMDYKSPEDLLASGEAATEEEANANYGPKWFIEIFDSEEEGGEPVVKTRNLWDPQTGWYTKRDWNMAKFDGKEMYLTSIDSNNSDAAFNDPNNAGGAHSVTLLDDGSLKFDCHTWTRFGKTYNVYLGSGILNTADNGSTSWNITYRTMSPIVLMPVTKSSSASAAASLRPESKMDVPQHSSIDVRKMTESLQSRRNR